MLYLTFLQFYISLKFLQLIIHFELRSLIINLISMNNKQVQKQSTTVTGFMNCNTLMVQSNCLTADKMALHLPAYLTMEIRNFKSLSLEQLTAQAYISIELAINTTGLKYKLKRSLDQVTINLPLQGNIKLGQKKNKNYDIQSREWISGDNSLKIFKLNKIFKMIVEPYTRLTPFEIIDLILTLNIKTLKVSNFKKQQDKDRQLLPNHDKYKKLKNIQIKLNLMDNIQFPLGQEAYKNQNDEKQINKKDERISFTSDGSFGNYDLAQKKLAVEYTMSSEESTLVQLKKYTFNQQWCKQNDLQSQQQKKRMNRMKIDQKIKFIQYAHFHIPLYKFPFVPLFIVLVPLALLGVINIAIFYQDDSLGDRIGNIATLMIAFVGMIPVIREQIPPTPYITIIQIFIYFEIFTALLCLIHSWMMNAGLSSDSAQVFLVVSIIITAFVFLVPVLTMIFHCVWLESSYNSKGSFENKRCQSDFLTKWNGNLESVRYFQFQHKEEKIWLQYIEKQNQNIKQVLDYLEGSIE